MKRSLVSFLFFTSYFIAETKPPNKAQELLLKSGNLHYYQNQIVLSDKVIAKGRGFTIKSHILTGFIKEQNGQLGRLELRKNVYFITKSYTAYAQYAVYSLEENILTLLKKPQIIQKNNLLEAKKIVVYQKTNRMLFIQPKITFYRKIAKK